MYEFFWEMAEVVLNSKYYLKFKKALNCKIKNSPKKVAFQRSDQDFIWTDGINITSWYAYLENQYRTIQLIAGLKKEVDSETGWPHPDFQMACISESGEIDTWNAFSQYEDGNWVTKYLRSDPKTWNDRQDEKIQLHNLIEIIQKNFEFADKQHEDTFKNIFQNALFALDGKEYKNAKTILYDLPPSYSTQARWFYYILQSLGTVFDGMGNWDDGGVPTELTDELYKQFIQGVLYCVNAGDEPGFSLEG